MKTEVKPINSKLSNAEEWISDLEVRIMDITKSEQQTEGQMERKWKQYKKPMG